MQHWTQLTSIVWKKRSKKYILCSTEKKNVFENHGDEYMITDLYSIYMSSVKDITSHHLQY